MNAKQKSRPSNWPIPADIVNEFRERKREKGIAIIRSIEDAIRYALKERRTWW
jgi:hypothetical protein